MTKKDYERAALIAQRRWRAEFDVYVRSAIIESFVELFAGDNPRFDEARFRAACVPGANVKARPKRA